MTTHVIILRVTLISSNNKLPFSIGKVTIISLNKLIITNKNRSKSLT